MSFRGLAEAVLILVLVGAFLGCLSYMEIERRMEGPQTPIVEAAAEMGATPSSDVGKAGHSAPSRPSSSWSQLEQRERELKDSEKALERWEGELERREEQLRNGSPDLGAGREDIEASFASEREALEQLASDLEDGREELERDRSEFEAWKGEVEAELASERKRLQQSASDLEADQEKLKRERVEFKAQREMAEAQLKAEGEQLEAEGESLDQAWNWAVLALCGAGALTIGNVAVAVARRHAGRREPGVATTAARTEPQRACLRPNQPAAASRGRVPQGREDRASAEAKQNGASILRSELIGQRQHASVEAGWLGRDEGGS